MVLRREHEAEAQLVDAARNRLGIELDLTPSASSRSAEPQRLVAERLPCLATAQPAPAAISAAVVETLKVVGPPPVPAVSTSGSRSTSTSAARLRIVRASPTSSGTVSPFVRNAIKNAPVWTSPARPSMISAEGGGGVVRGQVGAVADLVDGAGEDFVGHGGGRSRAQSPRKFPSKCLPWGVSTDSGWN